MSKNGGRSRASGANAPLRHDKVFNRLSESRTRPRQPDRMRRRRDHYADHYASETHRKRFNALARLEVYKRSLRNNQLKLQQLKENSHARLIKTTIERDARICKERKVRRAEIMAKTRGRGLRIRNTTWNMDSFIQCRG